MEENLYTEGDRIWFLDEGKAKRGKVLDAMNDGESWEYAVEDRDGGIMNLDEYEIFPTPETLVRDIFEDFELGEDLDIDIMPKDNEL